MLTLNWGMDTTLLTYDYSKRYLSPERTSLANLAVNSLSGGQ